MDSKPARDAAAKAKMEAEASAASEGPVHQDNEWNIRYTIPHQLQFIFTQAVIYLCPRLPFIYVSLTFFVQDKCIAT